jgi:competence protein ComEC
MFLASCLTTSLFALLPWGSAGARALTLLPVGDGQCVIVQTHGKILVLDCGDREGGQQALRKLRAFFEEKALRGIDLLVLSHGDSDHSGGLEGLLENFQVDKVLLPAHPKCSSLLRILEQRGQPHRLLLSGESWNWDGWFETKLPLNSADLQSSNDGGLLSWIRLDERLTFLCLGDHEKRTLDRILELLDKKNFLQKKPLALLLPHHGAPSEALLRFVNQLQPSVLLESSGRPRALRQESFHHNLGQKVWSTGLGGRVSLQEKGGVWTILEENPKRNL